MRSPLLAKIALVLLVSGCSGPLTLSLWGGSPGSGQVAQNVPVVALADLEIQTVVLPGGLWTQTVVNNYTASSINHLVIKLFRLNGNTENAALDASGNQVTKDIPGAQIGNNVVFTSLAANTTYRIRAYAYKVAGTDAGDVISTSDAASYTDVTLTNNDRPTLATLRVKLVDVLFDGQATSGGVAVTNGGYSTPGAEAIQ